MLIRHLTDRPSLANLDFDHTLLACSSHARAKLSSTTFLVSLFHHLLCLSYPPTLSAFVSSSQAAAAAVALSTCPGSSSSPSQPCVASYSSTVIMGRKGHPLAARIKKIMQTDEDVGKIAQATPIMIGRLLLLLPTFRLQI